jgi:type I restriction enzyme S subunit
MVSPAYVVLTPSEKLDPAFAEFLLSTRAAIGEFKRLSYGVVDDRLRLYYRDLIRIPLAFPCKLSEQRRIAAILSTVDETIQQTRALIAKYHNIETGLMRDLLTRGVTSDDRLRPTYTESPGIYKETSLGWIPSEWKVSTLGECCMWSSGGTPSRGKAEWWSGDVPWLTPKDMKAFELNDASEYISSEAARVGSRIAKAQTVFIVVRGMILAHSFPVVLGLREFAFNQDIKAVHARPELSSRFLAYWFRANADSFLKLTTESTHGTKRIELKDLIKVQIGLPPYDEQRKIAQRLDIMASMTGELGQSVEKLQDQKQGLMHDLLTGHVRVKVPASEDGPA